MTGLAKGIALGVVQVAMVFSLGGKLLIDRATMPRVWVKTAPYDPSLPIRGRYVSLMLLVDARGFEPLPAFPNGAMSHGRLRVEDGKLVAVRSPEGEWVRGDRLSAPVAYFIPEHVEDPSRRPPGEELWVEVTVPPKGPPRPIRLGVKKNGVLTPLDLH